MLLGKVIVGSKCFDAPVNYQLEFQEQASFFMHRIIEFHHSVLVVLTFVLIVVFFTIFKSQIHFYHKNRNKMIKTDFKQEHVHATTLEIIWTLIPTVILIIIAIPTFIGLYAFEQEYVLETHDTYKIIGNQWYWQYEYSGLLDVEAVESPEYVSYMVGTEDLEEGQLRLLEADSALIVPVEHRIRFIITSSDVIHSFAVPSLGIKLDAVPGRLNQVSLIVKRAGYFYGQCSEICGVDHAFMPINIVALYPLTQMDTGVFGTLDTSELGKLAPKANNVMLKGFMQFI